MIGRNNLTSGVLDTIERLLTAARRTEIADIGRYGPEPQGIAITYQSGALAFLWPTREPGRPVIWPYEMPDDRFVAQRALRLVADLLDDNPPHGWQWQPVAVFGVHLTPAALQIHAPELSLTLRATSTSPAGSRLMEQRHEDDGE